MRLPTALGSWGAGGGVAAPFSVDGVVLDLCLHKRQGDIFLRRSGIRLQLCGGCGGGAIQELMFQPRTTEVLSLAAMNSASCSGLRGHPAASPMRHRPRHLPALQSEQGPAPGPIGLLVGTDGHGLERKN